MNYGRANAYGNVLDNITDTIKWGVERNDKLALQDEEKRRYEIQQQRVAESDGRERTRFQNEQEDREKKEEAAWLDSMILAGQEDKVEEFLTVPENKVIAAKLSKKLLGEAQGDVDSVMRKSASGAFVTSFIKTQMADPAAAEMIKNPNGQPIVFNRANAPEVVFEKLSDSIHGFKSERKEIDYPDGGKGVYVRDANGNPVINDIRLLPGGKISYTYTIEKTNPDGSKQTLLAPPTEGRDVSDNARVVFRDLAELNDRAMKQSLGGLLTAFTHRHNQLDPEHTKNAIKGNEAAKVLEKELPGMAPAQQLQAKTAIGFLKSGEAKSIEEALKLAGVVKPGKVGMILPAGSIYVDPATGETLADNPKPEPNFDKTVKVDVGGGQEQTFQWNTETRQYDIPVGKPGPKHAAKGGGGGGSDKGDLQLQKDAYSNIKQRQADYDKRRADYNARLRNASEDEYPALRKEGADLEVDRVLIRDDMELYNKKHGKAFSLQDAQTPAPVRSGGGMASKPGAAVPSKSKPSQTRSPSPSPGIYAVNPQTKQRIVSYDNGRSWQAATK